MASVHSKTGTLDSVEVILDCDELGRADPRGFILGNNQTTKQLEQAGAFGLDTHLRSLEAASPASQDAHINAHVDFEVLHTRGWGDGPTGSIGTFRCREVSFRRAFPDRKPGDLRHVTFFMGGPTRHWHCNSRTETSFTGDVTVTVQNQQLPLDLSLPFDVTVRPHYFHARPADGHRLTDRVISLAAETRQSRDELSDQALIADATSIADDICLLMSFAASARVDWYWRRFACGDGYADDYRDIRTRQDGHRDWQDTPVRAHETRDFLRSSLPRLVALRGDGLDLRLAMLHVIGSNETRVLEERFLGLFLALEQLKDSYAARHGHEEILPDSTFRHLRRRLRDTMAKASSDADSGITITDDQLELFRRKLPDLNRPSFWDVLQKLLAEYGVKWRDIYPSEAELTRPRFIGLRDKLVHSGRTDSIEALYFETLRLEGVVERLILTMLGQNARSSPRAYFLLSQKMGD